MIEIILNGSQYQLKQPSTVAELIDSLRLPGSGIAVAINGEVIPRSKWVEMTLSAQDRVELLTIAQGG